VATTLEGSGTIEVHAPESQPRKQQNACFCRGCPPGRQVLTVALPTELEHAYRDVDALKRFSTTGSSNAVLAPAVFFSNVHGELAGGQWPALAASKKGASFELPWSHFVVRGLGGMPRVYIGARRPA